MGIRRKSRESAMQALFCIDMNPPVSDSWLSDFCKCYSPAQKSLPFLFELVNGVKPLRSEIDAIIERFSNNWKVSRMSCVDRNILRVAVYELFRCPDIPSTVSINEAIDIGKKFGTDESGAFINGILDSINTAINDSKIELKAELAEEPEKVDKQAESPEIHQQPLTDTRRKIRNHAQIKIKEGIVRRRPLKG